jgi:hypothetical protein
VVDAEAVFAALSKALAGAAAERVS